MAMAQVPADGNFTTAIQRGNHKAGEIQGQTRQHSRLINLLGVKQLCIGVNKMDCDTAGYKKDRCAWDLATLVSVDSSRSLQSIRKTDQF